MTPTLAICPAPTMPSLAAAMSLAWKIPLAVLAAGVLILCAVALLTWLEGRHIARLAADLHRRRQLHASWPEIFAQP